MESFCPSPTCRYWLAPIGKSLGIKSTKAKPPVPNKSLEDAYNKSSKLNHKTVSVNTTGTRVKAMVELDCNWRFLEQFLRNVFLFLSPSSLIFRRAKPLFQRSAGVDKVFYEFTVSLVQKLPSAS
jgi:hypothetical protein